MLFPAYSAGQVQHLARWFLIQFDWLTLFVATSAVVLCIAIAVLPVGNRKIGGEAATPEFRLTTWFSMLFAAGMGAGLVFWGAAEPVIHFNAPPPNGAPAGTDKALFDALAITQFHWSLHAWSVYAIAALAVAISTRPQDMPLPSNPVTFARRPIRRLIDWVAIGAVIFGIVASIGQGVIQLAAGVGLIGGGALSDGIGTQLVLLTILTASYLLSATSGLRRGIAWASNLNLVLALVLALSVFVLADTGRIIATFGESLAAYTKSLFMLSKELRPEGVARQWTRDWSLTYFLWWIAWTPFVGVFIARISRGRRLRTFVLGVVLVPCLVTLVWFSVFGGAALSLEASGVNLGVDDFETAPRATYAILSHLPLTRPLQILTFLLVFVFLLTSADSGSYVLAMFSRGRAGEPPIGERLFWGGVISILTFAAVLSADGQTATRAYAVAGAIPLVLLLMVQGAGLIRLCLVRDAREGPIENAAQNERRS